MASASCRLKG